MWNTLVKCRKCYFNLYYLQLQKQNNDVMYTYMNIYLNQKPKLLVILETLIFSKQYMIPWHWNLLHDLCL